MKKTIIATLLYAACSTAAFGESVREVAMKLTLSALLVISLLVPANAQQQFNPDQAAYSVTQSVMALASYARALEQQNAQLVKQIADLKSKQDTPKDKPKTDTK